MSAEAEWEGRPAEPRYCDEDPERWCEVATWEAARAERYRVALAAVVRAACPVLQGAPLPTSIEQARALVALDAAVAAAQSTFGSMPDAP